MKTKLATFEFEVNGERLTLKLHFANEIEEARIPFVTLTRDSEIRVVRKFE